MSRSAEQLAQARAAGIQGFEAAAASLERAELAVTKSREARMDAQRRLESLRRATASLRRQSELRADATREVLDSTRVVLLHRNEWLRGTLSTAFAQVGMTVVGEADDGADGVGVVLAEQPDVLLVEDRLPSMTSESVLRAVQEFAPGTLVCAHVGTDGDVGRLLDAGASLVFSRRVAAATLAEQVAEYLRSGREEPVLLR